ncbi:DUF5817 domain-containing protein [Methanohalophilus halophilus]|uniref:DUF5817 domain-containing protein n=1 Tax=Methanohalophilus halophilus TaxID=2177 RepID=A0A1L3Q0V9_9EURY|nr:hypothetical protein [Methanohalophilus halophilus]APH38473.1 hypothetical protein BHR79_02530 [Methanohalophilus halophilus]RNI10652.1 hypothetical protein EFE40_00255 [Methanohalophilus halophilus]SDW09712.1 hypothetical protein SAMN04515625_0333 [Methanohalophilus halophilus]
MVAYAVIICTKCRLQCQVIEDRSQKTIKCQRCGATLQFRKLRKFHRTEILDEAIAARTALQAKIQGSDSKKVSQILADASVDQLQPSPPNQKRSANPSKYIINALENQEKIQIRQLFQMAEDAGFEREKIEKALENLKNSGDIYTPGKGYLKLA